MKQILVILIINLIALTRESLCATSPCPDVIKFYRDASWNNYGVITIPPPGRGRTVLEVEIGIYETHDGGKTSLGLRKLLNDAVRDAENGKDIEYIYHFPQSRQLPIIRRITLNYRDICTGPQESNVATFWNKHQFDNPTGATQLSFIPNRQPTSQPVNNPRPVEPSRESRYPPIFVPEPSTSRSPYSWHRPNPTTAPPLTRPPSSWNALTRVSTRTPRPSLGSDSSWVESLPFANTCGRKLSTHLIIGGEDVFAGEFPWLVALFHYRGRTVDFVCGGSLISHKYVISAAHCTKGQQQVYLELGKHNITNTKEVGHIERNSRNIIEHPDYVHQEAHSDVALIEIDHVDFTIRIFPICLWTRGLDTSVQEGTVAGWGRVDNSGFSTGSQTPMKLKLKTVGLEKCRSSHSLFRHIATDKTFCAGGNSKGPCHGDSGGGFYMQENEIWYLRGIISTSFGTEHVCNVDEYAVYVDLTYFLKWMHPYLSS